MKPAKILLALFIGILLATTITACSKGKSPVEPVIDNVPISFGTESDNRSALAVYNAVIDPNAKTFTVEPANRTAEYHYPLTQLYPNVLQITNYGWTPNFWADIKITHPLPGSGIDGFDPRVIAILPANPGVSCNYPVFNVNANNAIILEPDGYTKMYDALGGTIAGNANPFIAYFKEQAYRQWSSINPVEETKRWQMDINGFGGSFEFKFVVDVSTNYPQPPQPVTDSALEPVQMQIEIGEGLTTDGGNATVTATFLDWQGHSEIKCKVESPDLFNGAIELFYSEPGPNPHEYIFTGTISNDLGAPLGDYNLLLAAWDINIGNHVFKECIASIDEIEFNPIEITPDQLNLSSYDIWVDDNYAYVAGGINGVHIVDVSDSANPAWVKKVEMPGRSYGIQVIDGRAFVADNYSLEIIDISQPETAYIVKSVDSTGYPQNVHVVDGYAYLASYSEGLEIIDIDPFDLSYVVNTIPTSDRAIDVYVSGDYAFVTVGNAGLDIVNINPPESAAIVKTIETPGESFSITVAGDYAYVTNRGVDGGLTIIDINPIADAQIVKTVELYYGYLHPKGVVVSGDYAFVACLSKGLYIVDISIPEDADVVHQVSAEGSNMGLCLSGNNAYMANRDYGFNIIDVETPTSAYTVSTYHTCGDANTVSVSDGYAYVFSSEMQIMDCDPAEDTHIINTFDIFAGESLHLYVEGDYLYLPILSTGLVIYDISIPESAFIVNTIEVPSHYNLIDGVFVADGLAYAWNNTDYDFFIMDVDPPETGFLFNTVYGNGWVKDIQVFGNYAYVQSYGMHIFDVSVPGYVQHVINVDIPGGSGSFDIDGELAFVSCYDNGIAVVDIHDPENANVIQYIDPDIYSVYNVFASNGYVYASSYNYDLAIIDVEPLGESHVVHTIEDFEYFTNFTIQDNYAYIAANAGGLRIIDLW